MIIKTKIIPISTILLLSVSLLLSACGQSSDATEEATTAPVEIVATTEPTSASLTTQNEPEEQAISSTDIAEAYPEPDENSTELMPLEVEEATDCEIESDLDLAGYPDLEEQMGCPLAEAIFHPIAINEFGVGPDYDRFMLWFGSENQIYVLFPDGSWQPYEDSWTEDQPIFSCNPSGIEEASPPLPRRGFGKLWCSDGHIQEQMGLIDREERLCQHSVLQQFEIGRLLACFEDDTIRYFRLLDDNTWD